MMKHTLELEATKGGCGCELSSSDRPAPTLLGLLALALVGAMRFRARLAPGRRAVEHNRVDRVFGSRAESQTVLRA
jgi:MYXO-CTERM domain-containing protein